MKDSDQAIEKVLAGLRDAEAPTGMESRILERIQNRTTDSVRRSWFKGLASRIAARPITYAAALAGMATIVLAVSVAVHQRKQTPVQTAKAVPLAVLPATSRSTEGISPEPKESTEIVRVSYKKNPATAVKLVDPEESLAAREMNAPSRPAPPLPLTPQEKLLVRFVRTSSPAELAAIDPAKWAAHDEQEKEEVDSFFGRSPKKQPVKTSTGKEQPVTQKLAEEALNKFLP